MKMPQEWLGEEVQGLMTDAAVATVAPVVVWGSVMSLAGGVRPSQVLIQSRLTTDHTDWAVTWLTDDLIGQVLASKGQERWNAYSLETAPDSLEAWVRPLSAVHRAVLTDVSAQQLNASHRQGDWSWSAGARIEFATGDVLELPAFRPDDTQYSDSKLVDAQVNEFLQATTRAMASRTA